MRAPWPQVGDFSEAAEHIFPKLQEVVAAIRTVRNEHKVDPKKRVTVSILAPGDSARQIDAAREMIELLATCTLGDVGPGLAPRVRTTRTTAAGCEIYVEGAVDEAAQEQRSMKRIEELERQVNAMRAPSATSRTRRRRPTSSSRRATNPRRRKRNWRS